MRKSSRRSVILTGFCGATLLLSGCSGSSDREHIVSDRVSVAEDEYQYFSFDLNRQAEVEYEFTVRNGPEIDVFLLDNQEFDEFQGGNRFRPYSATFGTGDGDMVTLDEGSYRLVVDNTNAGDASPPTNFNDDGVEVEIDAWVDG